MTRPVSWRPSRSTTVATHGNHEGIQDGAAANFSAVCTAERAITFTVAVQALTAGKLILFLEYVIVD